MADTCRMSHRLILICPPRFFTLPQLTSLGSDHLVDGEAAFFNLRWMEGVSRCLRHSRLYGSGLGARCHMLCRRLMRLACCIQSGSGMPLR